MKKRHISTITLPALRADQLRKIAKVRGVTITDLITGFIKKEIQRGTIADEMSGIRVGLKSGLLEITIEGIAVTFAPKQARLLANALYRTAWQPSYTDVKRNNGTISDLWGSAEWIPCDGGKHTVTVGRRGRGLVLSFDGRSKASVSLNPTDAADLSRVIRRTTAKIGNK